MEVEKAVKGQHEGAWGPECSVAWLRDCARRLVRRKLEAN